MICEMPTTTHYDDAYLKEIFLSCKSIAIVGLSPDESKDSHRVAKYLQEKGFKIYPVYPKEEMILGEKVYRSLLEIEEQVDMVDMFRKPEFAKNVLEDAVKRGDVKVVWLQLGIINNEVCEKAQELGIKAVQNRCTKIEYQRLVK